MMCREFFADYEGGGGTWFKNGWDHRVLSLEWRSTVCLVEDQGYLKAYYDEN